MRYVCHATYKKCSPQARVQADGLSVDDRTQSVPPHRVVCLFYARYATFQLYCHGAGMASLPRDTETRFPQKSAASVAQYQHVCGWGSGIGANEPGRQTSRADPAEEECKSLYQAAFEPN